MFLVKFYILQTHTHTHTHTLETSMKTFSASACLILVCVSVCEYDAPVKWLSIVICSHKPRAAVKTGAGIIYSIHTGLYNNKLGVTDTCNKVFFPDSSFTCKYRAVIIQLEGLDRKKQHFAKESIDFDYPSHDAIV